MTIRGLFAIVMACGLIFIDSSVIDGLITGLIFRELWFRSFHLIMGLHFTKSECSDYRIFVINVVVVV